jgi:tetratricopeptide (TPR) repeat protein
VLFEITTGFSISKINSGSKFGMTTSTAPQGVSPSRSFFRNRFAAKLQCFAGYVLIIWLVGISANRPRSGQAGEPAEAFVKQLRNAGYFDTAITYLDRVDTFAGVDPSFVSAIDLEKAQTYIDVALNARNPDDRDEALAKAESSLDTFLKQGSHPRMAEARLQLGKLQMNRAAQLLLGEPDDEKIKQARQSYLAAAKTFDGIVEDLRGKLKEMRGQKIDPQADPEAAARRDQYRSQFLQSQVNAAEAIKLAAKTFDDPGKDAKAQLEDAAARFTDLNKKYNEYIPGAIALMHLGQVNELLGKDAAAADNYLQMLEQPEADPLRDAKFQAATGLIRIRMKSDPPKYQQAIDRTAGWVNDVRPNEKNSPSVQEFRLELAKAYLAKSNDEERKKGERGRAKSEGRQLLLAASKVPGTHTDEVEQLLGDLGIEQETAELPTAEPPESFDDAMEKAREIVQINDELAKTVEMLGKQEKTDELTKQIAGLEEQITESRRLGAQILRAGLTMINEQTDTELLNQARQILTYFLFRTDRHREAVVVGSFLARQAPGTETGLKGGLMALTSMQKLLNEVPDEENAGLLRQLESLGKYLSSTWPEDPSAAAAQGIQIRLLLKKDDFDGAQQLIDKMADGPEKASFKRLLGRLLWNQSIKARVEEEDEAKSKALVEQAEANLKAGLDGITTNLVESEAMEAALVLTKIYLLEDNSEAALGVLDHPKYGLVNLIEKQDPPSQSFPGDVYTNELKALVGQMLASDTPDQYLDRMTKTMEKLRKSFSGADAAENLTRTYMVLATDLKEQLDEAPPARKAKLIEAFRVLLKRISDNTNDESTLRWVGQTLMSMGESLIDPGQTKATGQAADLISQAAATFEALPDQNDLTTAYLLGRAQRLVGKYSQSLDTLEQLLIEKPMMLDAQVEGALAYESWASEFKPSTAYKVYKVALQGGRPHGPKKQNAIWGWAEISKKTINYVNRNPNFEEKFFESRYHVALCLYLMGKSADRESEVRKAIKVIREAATLFPGLGGDEMRKKYNDLMKLAQREVGDQPVGIE